MNNRYCNNCFYWVNRKEDNPNISNCNVCASNPYNKYEGVVIKCKNNEELKIALEFFIKRGIPIGISKLRDIYPSYIGYPCYIGIDEYQVKLKYKFTINNVFTNKNIILGEISCSGEVITWNRYKYELIDKYLELKRALNISEEKNPPINGINLKDSGINTNSTVVGYIADYESPIKEELNSYEGYFIRLWDLDSSYENIIKFFNEVAKIPYSNTGGIGLGYISTYIGIHKGKIKMMSASKLNELRDKGELKFVCDIIKTNEKEGTICYNFYKGDEFAGVDCYWNKSNHDDKYEFSITIYKSKENQNPTKEDLKGVCECKCNKSESPTKEDSKNVYEMYMTNISGSRNEYIHVDFFSMDTNAKINYLYKLLTNR